MAPQLVSAPDCRKSEGGGSCCCDCRGGAGGCSRCCCCGGDESVDVTDAGVVSIYSNVRAAAAAGVGVVVVASSDAVLEEWSTPAAAALWLLFALIFLDEMVPLFVLQYYC